jgi:hypothetical protein
LTSRHHRQEAYCVRTPPDRRAAAGDPAVHAEGLGPLGRLGEGDGDQGEGGRRHEGGEPTLQRPGPEQHGRVLGDAAERGGEGEADQADDEHALTAHEVGDPAAEQQQATEGQGVGGDDPLAVVDRDVQRLLGRRQGDRHDRRVEHDHQLGDGDNRQC